VYAKTKAEHTGRSVTESITTTDYAISENLATGKVTVIEADQLKWEDRKTKEYMDKHGHCDNVCAWVDQYGWVPECGCPVHD